MKKTIDKINQYSKPVAVFDFINYIQVVQIEGNAFKNLLENKRCELLGIYDKNVTESMLYEDQEEAYRNYI